MAVEQPVAPARPHPVAKLEPRPGWILWLVIGYLFLLPALAIAYRHFTWMQQLIPDLGVDHVPIGVAWMGALGALTNSVNGVLRHGGSWNPDYNLWHATRPALGAIVGSVSVLMFAVLMSSSGATSTTYTTFYVLAFVSGYREQTFRELIKRVTDMILSPTDKAGKSGDGQSVTAPHK